MMWNEMVNANCRRARRMGSKPMAATLAADTFGRTQHSGPAGNRLCGKFSRERLLDRQEIAPCEALLQRLAQQIGRVERRDRADLARAGVECEPAAAGLEDTLARAEQRLGGRAAEADQHVRIGELDLAAHERQADLGLLRGPRAVAGRPARNEVGEVGLAGVEAE